MGLKKALQDKAPGFSPVNQGYGLRIPLLPKRLESLESQSVEGK